jgi:HAD superfamily hydrolase (TIGR01509 family)
MTTNLYKFYVFDFDGTLVDSMPYFGALMVKILDEAGVSYPDDIVKIITPLGYGGTADYFRETLGLTVEKEELVRRMLTLAKEDYQYNIPLKEGVREGLLALKAQGASLNILTASPHDVLDVCLIRLGVYELFDNVWSCEDFGTTKADPQIYREVANRLGTLPEGYLFIDDNLGAVMTAKEAGVCAFGIYDKSGEEFADTLRARADGYLMTLKDLL